MDFSGMEARKLRRDGIRNTMKRALMDVVDVVETVEGKDYDGTDI